jgi:hypothetical protein
MDTQNDGHSKRCTLKTMHTQNDAHSKRWTLKTMDTQNDAHSKRCTLKTMDTYPTLVQRLTQRAAKQHVLGVIGHTLFVGSGGQRREILVQGLASGQIFRESGMPCLNQEKKEGSVRSCSSSLQSHIKESPRKDMDQCKHRDPSMSFHAMVGKIHHEYHEHHEYHQHVASNTVHCSSCNDPRTRASQERQPASLSARLVLATDNNNAALCLPSSASVLAFFWSNFCFRRRAPRSFRFCFSSTARSCKRFM